jgi:hypothetical protein
MPDRRRHRGPHPQDRELFAPDRLPALRAAVADLAWLLGRGYAIRAGLKLVGDRHQLRTRQRMAVMRATCSDAQRAQRRARRVAPGDLRGTPVSVDGYNVLITVESALAGGVLLRCRDGCLRDLASLHGHFKRVEETVPAVDALGSWLAARGPDAVTVLLDRPVSNSGRLAALLRERSAERGWGWSVALDPVPDRTLRRGPSVAATSDSAVLDAVPRWLDLARHVAEGLDPRPAWIDLG